VTDVADPQFATLDELVSSVIERAIPAVIAALTPIIAQRIDGALSLADNRHAQMLQTVQAYGVQHTQAMQEVKAAIPVMPDLRPLVTALEANTAADRSETDLQPLVQAITALVKQMASSDRAMREMCDRMDKPVTREGTAELPSGGTVKLRIVEKPK